MSPWQNQFHDFEFLDEAFLDITVINCKVFEKDMFDFFCQFWKLVKSIEYETTRRKMKSLKSFMSWLGDIPPGDKRNS